MQKFLYILVMLQIFCPVISASYDDAFKLESFLFSNYSTRIRPVLNHSQPTEVTCSFLLATITQVDEIHATLSTIGILNITWMDEVLQWDPSDYGGITYLYPYPKDVWRPRLAFVNSQDDIDPFGDNYDFLLLEYTGHVTWRPGGLFRSLCVLNLERFPFDQHDCTLRFTPIFNNGLDIKLLVKESDVVEDHYEKNGEWMLTHAKAHGCGTYLEIALVIARRPHYFVMNFLIPIMLLSVLNLLSFTMVVNDGSVNISHSMTVLLAYTIYMSFMIDHLPSISMNMPYLTFYIFLLFVISLLTTVDIVFIVWLNNKEEEEIKKQKRESRLKGAMNKLIGCKRMTPKQVSPSKIPAVLPTTVMDSLQFTNTTFETTPGKDPSTEDITDNTDKMNPSSTLPAQPFPVDVVTTGDVAGYDVTTRSLHINSYKNMSEKVRVYSLYVFILINGLATSMICVLLAKDGYSLESVVACHSSKV